MKLYIPAPFTSLVIDCRGVRGIMIYASTGGIVVSLASGIVLALVGIVLSRVACLNIHPIVFYATGCFAAAIASWLLVADWQAIISIELAQLLRLLGWISLAGIFNCVAQFLTVIIMRRGHQAISWSILQSSMAIPFLVSILFWRESAGILAWIGVGVIVVSMRVMGANRLAGGNSSTLTPQGGGISLALLGMLFAGTAQSVMAILSHLEHVDAARLRVPLYFTVSAVMHGVFVLLAGLTSNRRAWLFGVLWAILAMIYYLLIFAALDVMTSAKLSAVVFPVSVATCIAGFSLYSAIIIKEPFKWPTRIGLFLSLVGILLLTLR